LRLAVVTSRSIIYPTLKFPQYLDQDNCFNSLSAKGELFLVGNILEPRPYATSQLRFSSLLNRLPLAWNNRYASFLSIIPAVEKLRDGLDLFSDSLYTSSCLEFLQSSNVDSVYSFPIPFDRYVVRLARKIAKPLIIEMWEDYACFTSIIMTSLGLPQSIVNRETKRHYKWMRDMANEAERVIVPTRIFADRLEDMGVESGKMRVIPVCVDPSEASNVQYPREKHELKNDEKVVFHIGGLAPWHDLSTLMKSIQYVNSRFIFIIAGGRSRVLEEQAGHYSSDKVRVIFTGKLEPNEVGSYLSLADICVAPYRFPKPSGFFPAKVIRYMLAGKAIVVTDTPEIQEMFRNRKVGILVAQEDPEALAQALDHLAENIDERIRLGSAAKEIAENSYLIKHHTEQLVKVFKEIT